MTIKTFVHEDTSDKYIRDYIKPPHTGLRHINDREQTISSKPVHIHSLMCKYKNIKDKPLSKYYLKINFVIT